MSSITKTQATSLLAVQSIASNTTVISSVLSVTTALAASIFIHFGRRSNTALTEAVQIRIEASSKASADGHWYPIATFLTQIAAVTNQPAVLAASGQNVATMASTTGMSADYAATTPVGNRVYFDNTTIGNSEFHTVKLVTSNTSITLEDNLVNTQSAIANVFPSAEFFMAQIDCTAIGRLRVVIAANNTGVAVAAEVLAITGDSIG